MKKLTQEEFLRRVQTLYPDCDFSKSIYRGSRQSVIVISKILGEVEVVASNLLKGIWANSIKSGTNKAWNTEKFIWKAQETFPDKNFDYSKTIYINNDSKVIIGCPIHGDFVIRPGDFLRQSGCPMCKPKSLGELFIQSWLEDNGIEYQKQVRILLKMEDLHLLTLRLVTLLQSMTAYNILRKYLSLNMVILLNLILNIRKSEIFW